MARAGTQSATTSSTTAVFDASTADGPCRVFKVANDAASSGNALVHVNGVHNANEYDVIPPGGKEYYKAEGGNGIVSVIIKSNSTATAYYSVVA